MPRRIRNTESFDRAAYLLEEAFFLKQDLILLRRLQAMKKMDQTKESLAAVSGISNDAILTRLIDLKIKPEILAALAAVPLIEVAWADGKIDEPERAVVLAHATSKGIRPGSIEHDLLEQWLMHRPGPTLMEAWQAYLQGLCERLTDEERAILRDELLESTKATAEASGGFLNIGRISQSEKDVLEKLAGSFCF